MDTIPDTFTTDLAWHASSTATSTPSFDVHVSWDHGASWIELASSTADTELRYQAAEGGDPTFRVRAQDSSGQSDWSTRGLDDPFIAYPKTVVINELAPWGIMGHPDDEWIELYNTTGHPLDLTGWTVTNIDGSLVIPLAGTVNPYNYFILEHGDDDALSNIPADQIFIGRINDRGEDLFLKDASGAVVDRLSFASGWPVSDGAEFAPTIMRVIFSASGSDDQNWSNTFEGFEPYAEDREGVLISGAPAQANHAIMRLQGTLMENLVLTAEAGPYEVGLSGLQIAEGATLTILPGAVMRFVEYHTNALIAEPGSRLSAQGTAERPVIFTSIYDDYYERANPTSRSASGPVEKHPIIREGTTTVKIYSDNVIVDNVKILLNGIDGIIIEDARPTLKNSRLPGITVTNGNPTIENSELRGNLRLVGAAAKLENNTMRAPNRVFLSGTLPADFTMTKTYSWTIDDNFKVPQGVTLTIGPGTRIDVDDPLSANREEIIVIEGRLLAQGTPEDKILFTVLEDPEPNDSILYYRINIFGPNYFWSGMKFIHTVEDSYLTNTVIRYAGSLPFSGGFEGPKQNSVVSWIPIVISYLIQ